MTEIPTLPPGNCQLWWASPQDARPDHERLLNPVERGRATDYRRDIDRRRFGVGVAMSRLVAGRLLDVDPADVPIDRSCPDCGGPHGRPRIVDSDLRLSISHSGDLIGLVVARDTEIGLDVEEIDADRSEAIPSVLTDPERAAMDQADDPTLWLFRYWVRKEAVLKATGDGLMVPMTDLTVSRPDRPAAVLSFRDDPDTIELTDLDAGEHHLASLASVGPLPFVTVHDGSALLAG